MGILVLPLLFLTAVIAFYNDPADRRPLPAISLFTFYGLLYGVLAGLFLAIFTSKLRQSWRLVGSSTVGFAVGGALAGLFIYWHEARDFLNSLPDWLFVTGLFLLLGASGGAALGVAYHWLARAEATRGERAKERPRWFRFARIAVLVVLAAAFIAITFNLVRLIRIDHADLQTVIPIGAQGTHWSAPVRLEDGSQLTLSASLEETPLTAWCSEDGQVMVQEGAGSPERIPFPTCDGRPALVQDSNGNLHLLWHSTDVEKATGYIAHDQSLIYESVRQDGEWGEAAIVAQTVGETELELTAVNNTLQLTWTDETGRYTSIQTPYDCAEPDLNAIEQAVYDALNQPTFKPADEQLPVCGHQYDALLFTPNPEDSSRFTPTPNGAFDEVTAMALGAQYEVLFGIMQWDRPATPYSPGSTLAQAIVELYNRVKEDPAQYPKGMTVRILTGNMPQLSLFPVPDHTWHVLEDLQAAGLPELVNEELGWRVEIADFDGRWPHMHTKTMIVDGKTMMAAGFNYSYLHFANDHPSELGIDMFDLGIHITGPVAQAGRAAYDDQWSQSHTLECAEWVGWLENVWRRDCWRGTAVADHLPEVLKYDVPPAANSNAYAMYRTEKHLAADAAVEAAIRAAEEKIDIFQVNFSLELLCTAAIVFQGICDYDNNALPFLVAILETIEAKRIPVRILVEEEPMNGAENRVAIQAFVDELEERGLRDLVEIRFYDGKIHNKSLSIDEQFLVVGSQNFHYSAWGSHEFSLTEFNIGTDNVQAIEDFQSTFEYRWQNSIPAEELMPSLRE
jgi:phosphatidylserine/phosphatidylglycerophosphate/cardiolipin synthase-like enzyme